MIFASVSVYYMVVFVIINNVEMMINAGANAKNKLRKKYVIKDSLGGIEVIVSENVINHVIPESIQTMTIVSIEKSQLINQLKNELKILMK